MDIFTSNEYLTPELLWGSFGIISFEQFLDKFLVKGRFHKDVPEDVIQEFKTIEYLLSHSYFGYFSDTDPHFGDVDPLRF